MGKRQQAKAMDYALNHLQHRFLRAGRMLVAGGSVVVTHATIGGQAAASALVGFALLLLGVFLILLSPVVTQFPEQHRSAPPLPTPCSCISSRRRGTKLASHGRAQQSVCIVWIVQYQNVLLYFSSAFFPLRVIECLWDFWECRLLIPCILLLTVLLHVSYL